LEAEEVDARCQVLKDLEDAMHAKWGLSSSSSSSSSRSQSVMGAVTLHPFGSFPAGLSTFMSDIDISILQAEAVAETETETETNAVPQTKREIVVLLSDEEEDEEI
jgi:DNA polymerase sigma